MLPFLFIFITQRAVKAWIIENSQEKMNCVLVNNNSINLIHFIDFKKTANIWPKQDLTPIGVTVAHQNNSKIKKDPILSQPNINLT